MGLINWLRKLLKAEITHTHNIQYAKIEMPQPGNCIIFMFDPGTPPEVIDAFDRRLVEFQNQDRPFIVTNLKVVIKENAKKDVAVEEDKSGRNPTDQSNRHTTAEAKGQAKK